jgi:hypothetical protein
MHGSNARGYNWATLFLGEINTGTWPSKLGDSQKQRQNMLMGPVGFRSEKGCADDAQQKLKTTDPTSRLRGCPTTHLQLSKNN